jgi:putative transposase
MARPLRIEFPGALYHVTARGNARHAIFFGDVQEDRALWLNVLSQTMGRFHGRCHAYCLMTNHYHLLLETPDGNLSKGMRQLGGVYTQYVNRTHGRVGHLFQGRFKAILVEKERYLLELARYVVLNPVRSGLAVKPEDWPWSSYRSTAGLEAAPSCLDIDWLLRAFSDQRQPAQAQYRRFVAAGLHAARLWEELKNQVYLGFERFVERMQAMIDSERPLHEVPKVQRRLVAKPLADDAARHDDRDQAMAAAYGCEAYSMQAIADHFGVSRMTVSRAVKRFEAEQAKVTDRS